MFNFVRIKANLTKCRLEGGFDKLFRCFAGDNLETLEVRLTES